MPKISSTKEYNNRSFMDQKVKAFHTTVDGVPVRKIFVANLPNKITNSELMNRFQGYGKIKYVSIVSRTPNRSSAFAFVTYYSPGDASRAIEDKNIFFRWRKLYVSPADSWHQPVELSDGTIVWDNRLIKKQTNGDDDSDEKQEEEDDGVDEEEGDDDEEPLVINDEITCPISKLNDDCLHLIFNHLSLSERIPVGQVCRRWRKVNETMWNGIRKLDFSSSPLSEENLTNNLLQLYLSLCPNITSLNIANSSHELTSGAIVAIAKSCSFLEELTIRNIPIQKRSLALLAQYCPNLTAFYMNACANNHDGEMITLVQKCKNLQKIGLKFSSSISGSWLKYLRCPLESLALEMYEMDPDYLLKGISRVQNTLKELSFISCPAIRSSDLDAIAEMVPNLTFLTLAGMFSLVRHNALLPVTKLKNLIRLDLEQNSVVCDEFMKNLIENCPSLVHLNLSETDHYHLTEKGLILVAQLTNLTHLRLACHTILNDTILRAMSKKLKNLKHLDIMGCQSITDQGCIDIIKNCSQLETLDVSGCQNISNSIVQAAITLVEGGCRKKLYIIAGGTKVQTDVLIIKPEIQPYLNIDLQTSIISRYDDLYDNLYGSEYDISDFSLDDVEDDDDDIDDEGLESYDLPRYLYDHYLKFPD